MDPARVANQLYWDIVFIIEPALQGHVPRFDEPLAEKSTRLAMEAAAKTKAALIMEKLRAARLVMPIVPSSDPS